MSGSSPFVRQFSYLYHDGFSVRGISFAPDKELAQNYDVMVVDSDVASNFVHGKFNPREWFIWQTPNGPTLCKNDEQASLNLEFIDEHYRVLPEAKQTCQPWIAVKVYMGTDQISVCYNTAAKFDCGSEFLQFVFTERGDPSAVKASIHVPVSELLAEHSVTVTVGFTIKTRMDVYTKRVFEGYGVEHLAENENMLLNIPKGHFIDLVKFQKVPITRGLRAVVNRRKGTLHLSLIGGGIAVYQRSLSHFKLLFSMPDDPSLVLHTATVPTQCLREGVTLELPAILHQPFDVWTQLFYRNMSIVDAG